MKNLKCSVMVGAIWLSLVSSALAETSVRQDDSNMLVWLFLGACALIILMQLIPVITMTFGLIKGAIGSKKAEVAPATSKYRE